MSAVTFYTSLFAIQVETKKHTRKHATRKIEEKKQKSNK